MSLAYDMARCHGLRMSKADPLLPDCWDCKRLASLGNIGMLTPVWRHPVVTMAVGDDGIARVACHFRLPFGG